MNETETRAEHIDPALKAAGWGVVAGSRIRSIIEFKQIIGRAMENFFAIFPRYGRFFSTLWKNRPDFSTL